MQNFEDALVDELKTISELNNRIYPLHSKEANKKNGVPYVIYASSEGLHDKSLEGYLDSKEVRCELNVIAQNYRSMKAITKKVIAILLSFECRQIGTDGPHINEMTYRMPVELYEHQPDLHRCVIEFSVHFKE